MTEKSDTLCGICNVRNIQGTGTTCFYFRCKRKGIRARCLKSSKKLQGEEDNPHCDKKLKLNEEDVPKMCVFCKIRPVNIGKAVCFYDNCRRSYRKTPVANKMKVKTVKEDEESSEDKSNNSSDSGCDAWDSDGKLSENESDAELSEKESDAVDSNYSLGEIENEQHSSDKEPDNTFMSAHIPWRKEKALKEQHLLTK